MKNEGDNMKIIMDISKEVYNDIKNNHVIFEEYNKEIAESISKSIPFSKNCESAIYNCDNCLYKNSDYSDYPCCICSHNIWNSYSNMWEREK